jgi:mannosyltransferase OCH1-like enzyme
MQDVAIPQKLHFIWLGGPMPNHLRANVKAWEMMHPQWCLHLWTEQNLPKLRNQGLFDRADRLVPRDAVYQFQADIARYELLYDIGGFYADVDTRPLRPVDESLLGHREFAAMEDRNWVGNTYLGAVARHPVFLDLITGLPGNVQRLRGKRPNHLSGPRYLTTAWNRHHAYVAPSHQWYPYSYTDVKNGTVPTDYHPDAVAVHQWFHTASIMEARRAHTR